MLDGIEMYVVDVALEITPRRGRCGSQNRLCQSASSPFGLRFCRDTRKQSEYC
jgi:hypothetical protein